MIHLVKGIHTKDDPADLLEDQEIRRIFSWRDSQSAKATQTLTDEETGLSVEVIPHPVSFADLARLLHMEPTHYGCVALKAAAVGGSSWQLETPGNQEVPKDLTAFFEDPNPDFSLTELLRNAEIDFQATGNAYVEVVTTVGGKPKILVPVPSYTIYIVDKEATAEKYKLPVEAIPEYCQFQPGQSSDSGTLSFYRIAGKPEPKKFQNLPVSSIIHLREYSPVNEFYGIPAILAALEQVLVIRSALRYKLRVFDDEGIGPTVFHFEGTESLSPDDEHRLQQYIGEEVRKGVGKILAITTEPGTKLNIHKLSMIAELGADTLREMLNSARDEILRVHRVPPRLVSVADTRGLGGSAEALAQMEQFQAMVIDARQQMWMTKINKHIIRDGFKSKTVQLKIKPISLRSLMDLQKYYLGWLTHGILNADEVRKIVLGLDELPNGIGKEYRIMLGGTPVSLAEAPGPKPGETVTGIASTEEAP